jgi:hypothetical protein
VTGLRLNDFHRFDPNTSSWTNLTSVTTGGAPSPRGYLGFASVSSSLYVFGGNDPPHGEFNLKSVLYSASSAVGTHGSRTVIGSCQV